ncbi:MAG TPA: alanine racemase, partial [Mycobacteriales bacterium]|nr:alanine racemase [Mycobacteriales bacterium]
LLLANEVLDARRLGAVVAAGARVTLAVDSPDTVDAAARGGVREVVVDVNVGLPRCGCEPGDAGRLADRARARGLEVRGVMGYEGHLMLVPEDERRAGVQACMALLLSAAADAGGELVSAGGTGTYAVNTWASEIQAGSYALMDTAYGALELPFRQALTVLGRVVSVSAGGWAVADVGLKALGMDHGNPTLPGATVWFCSDEHLTFSPDEPGAVRVGDLVRVVPAHVDPTVALHDRMHLVGDGDEVLETWDVDLRGW